MQAFQPQNIAGQKHGLFVARVLLTVAGSLGYFSKWLQI